MLDNISFSINNVSTDDFKKILLNIGIETPKISERIIISYYNLRIEYYPNSRILKIKNSIHKFYNAVNNGLPHNSNDFDFEQFSSIVNFLEENTERSSNEMLIHSPFEFGLNINTGSVTPLYVISRYKSCSINSHNEFHTVLPRNGKPFQKVCCFSDYRIKGYDKSIQGGITGKNIFRFEIVVTELRKLKHILKKADSITLNYLNDRDVWATLFEYMLSIYDRIAKIPYIDEITPVQDINSIYNYSEKLMAEDISKTMKRSVYQKFRKNSKDVYVTYDSKVENIHNKIRQQMVEKFKDLYN